jgi:hypothetical protein
LGVVLDHAAGRLEGTAMTDADPLPADVFVAVQLTPEWEGSIVDAMAALGASARVRALPRRRGASELPWIVLATLPVQAFLAGIGTKIAGDAYPALQDAVRKLLRREHADQAPAAGPLVLQDASSGLQIVLDHDLPAEGYRQLLTLDLSRYRLGPVHYDRAQQRWRSELDEAACG